MTLYSQIIDRIHDAEKVEQLTDIMHENKRRLNLMRNDKCEKIRGEYIVIMNTLTYCKKQIQNSGKKCYGYRNRGKSCQT